MSRKRPNTIVNMDIQSPIASMNRITELSKDSMYQRIGYNSQAQLLFRLNQSRRWSPRMRTSDFCSSSNGGYLDFV